MKGDSTEECLILAAQSNIDKAAEIRKLKKKLAIVERALELAGKRIRDLIPPSYSEIVCDLKTFISKFTAQAEREVNIPKRLCYNCADKETCELQIMMKDTHPCSYYKEEPCEK